MQYCERTGAGFWAEPVNAMTNLAFLVAAVGVGSFLWHTFATPWAEWADVIPIGLFIAVFLASFLRRVAGLRWSAVAALSLPPQTLR